jgi:hypothetical protein
MRAFAGHFRAALLDAFDSKLNSFYLYGAAMFPHPASWRLDFDFHVIISEPLSQIEIDHMLTLREALGEKHELGRDLDGYTLLLSDAMRRGLPHDQVLGPHIIDESWALHRAHVHAGRFHLVCGADPRSFVPVPEWQELVEGLDCELRFVVENPQHPHFGMLNLARLLYSWTTHDVVLSKYQAAQWALGGLPQEFSGAIEAALRSYERRSRPEDRLLLERTFPDFLSFATARLAALRD